MNLRRFIFLGIVLNVTFVPGAWADSIWDAVTEMATCRTYERLESYLRDHEYRCRDDAPSFHESLTGEKWISEEGLSACYVGSPDQFLEGPSGYRCSVIGDGKERRNLVCTRRFPFEEMDDSKYSLKHREEELFQRALELGKCKGKPIEMSFAGRHLVPQFLWKWYRHELGVALNRHDSLMYLGLGRPAVCGKTLEETEGSVGIISFFVGPGGSGRPEPLPPHPFFWEKRKDVGQGVSMTIGGLKDLAEIQAEHDPNRTWGVIRSRLSISMGTVGARARATFDLENLETLAWFRELDFESIFEFAWLDLEIDLELEALYLDLEEDVDLDRELYPGFQEFRCNLGGHVDMDALFESIVVEAQTFLGRGLRGCEDGAVLLITHPMVHRSSLEAKTGFTLMGRRLRGYFGDAAMDIGSRGRSSCPRSARRTGAGPMRSTRLGAALVAILVTNSAVIPALSHESGLVSESSSEFLASLPDSMAELERAGLFERLVQPGFGSEAVEPDVHEFITDLHEAVVSLPKEPFFGADDPVTEYDVIVQVGHFLRKGNRNNETGTRGTIDGRTVHERDLAAYVSLGIARILADLDVEFLVVSADENWHSADLRTKVFLAIHFGGSRDRGIQDSSLGYGRKEHTLGAHAVGWALARSRNIEYGEFMRHNFTANLARYHAFDHVQSSKFEAVLELATLSCAGEARDVMMAMPWLINNLAIVLEIMVKKLVV